jgi:hypothetical protein
MALANFLYGPPKASALSAILYLSVTELSLSLLLVSSLPSLQWLSRVCLGRSPQVIITTIAFGATVKEPPLLLSEHRKDALSSGLNEDQYL